MADAVERLVEIFVEAIAHCKNVIANGAASEKQRDLCRDVVASLESHEAYLLAAGLADLLGHLKPTFDKVQSAGTRISEMGPHLLTIRNTIKSFATFLVGSRFAVAVESLDSGLDVGVNIRMLHFYKALVYMRDIKGKVTLGGRAIDFKYRQQNEKTALTRLRLIGEAMLEDLEKRFPPTLLTEAFEIFEYDYSVRGEAQYAGIIENAIRTLAARFIDGLTSDGPEMDSLQVAFRTMWDARSSLGRGVGKDPLRMWLKVLKGAPRVSSENRDKVQTLISAWNAARVGTADLERMFKGTKDSVESAQDKNEAETNQAVFRILMSPFTQSYGSEGYEAFLANVHADLEQADKRRRPGGAGKNREDLGGEHDKKRRGKYQLAFYRRASELIELEESAKAELEEKKINALSGFTEAQLSAGTLADKPYALHCIELVFSPLCADSDEAGAFATFLYDRWEKQHTKAQKGERLSFNRAQKSTPKPKAKGKAAPRGRFQPSPFETFLFAELRPLANTAQRNVFGAQALAEFRFPKGKKRRNEERETLNEERETLT